MNKNCNNNKEILKFNYNHQDIYKMLIWNCYKINNIYLRKIKFYKNRKKSNKIQQINITVRTPTTLQYQISLQIAPSDTDINTIITIAINTKASASTNDIIYVSLLTSEIQFNFINIMPYIQASYIESITTIFNTYIPVPDISANPTEITRRTRIRQLYLE